MNITTYMTRQTLEDLVFNTLAQGYTMRQIRNAIKKLNIQVREG